MGIRRILLGAAAVVAGSALSVGQSGATVVSARARTAGLLLSSAASSSATLRTPAFAAARQIVVPRSRAQGTPTALGQGSVVRVNANQHWTPTNITVRSGDRLVFQVTGQIRPVGGGGLVGPEGGTGKSPNFPLPDANIGTLIGRVGDSQPFPIGGAGEVTMPADGPLFLGINDDNTSDNSGFFTVRIASSRAVGTTGSTATTLPFGQGNTITVDAKRPWTDTGISVQQGERITFSVTGSVTWGNGPNDRTTGDGGAIDPMRQKDYPVPSVGVAALIGRVNNEPFAIGRSGQAIVMPASGELFLGINDDYFGDNNGAYTVTLRVTGGAIPRR
ncbi:MAG: hypothetical protein ACM3NQ_22565 [Bacteroidales bacterium]